MAEKMHLQLSAEAEEYLANRGLMPGTIKYAKIGEFKKMEKDGCQSRFLEVHKKSVFSN